jgi:hypothetical protein
LEGEVLVRENAMFFLVKANIVAGVFLVQSIIIYTVGIKLWMLMDGARVNSSISILASFVACASSVAVASEMFYRLVDLPSIAAAKTFWAWMIR